MQAGARLKKDPEASPKTQLNMYSPGRVCPKGSQITNIAKTPTTISAVWVLIRPYLSAKPPASSRPIVEHLVNRGSQRSISIPASSMAQHTRSEVREE